MNELYKQVGGQQESCSCFITYVACIIIRNGLQSLPAVLRTCLVRNFVLLEFCKILTFVGCNQLIVEVKFNLCSSDVIIVTNEYVAGCCHVLLALLNAVNYDSGLSGINYKVYCSCFYNAAILLYGAVGVLVACFINRSY